MVGFATLTSAVLMLILFYIWIRIQFLRSHPDLNGNDPDLQYFLQVCSWLLDQGMEIYISSFMDKEVSVYIQ